MFRHETQVCQKSVEANKHVNRFSLEDKIEKWVRNKTVKQKGLGSSLVM